MALTPVAPQTVQDKIKGAIPDKGTTVFEVVLHVEQLDGEHAMLPEFLNYLRRLPIQGLKLSQLFVEGVPRNHSDVAVCQAIAGIARSLGLGLVAEGVESEAQRQFLLELGVQVGQGFLFAPGLTPSEFERRIAAPQPASATG